MAGLRKIRIDKFKGYIVNGEYFEKKDDVKKRASSILNSYEIGAFLSGNDLDFVLALLDNHPESTSKKGEGVKSIKIVPHEEFGKKNKSFAIVRVDGTETDFSFMKCITPPTPLGVFKQTCRRTIEFQIVSFKKKYFKDNEDSNGFIVCPITNELVNFENAHVDHQPPKTFDRLVEAFVQQFQIDISQVEIGGVADGDVVRYFVDKKLSVEWQEFHRRNADLRVVSEYANLSVINREQPKISSQLTLF